MSDNKSADTLLQEWRDYWTAQNEPGLVLFVMKVQEELTRLRAELAAEKMFRVLMVEAANSGEDEPMLAAEWIKDCDEEAAIRASNAKGGHGDDGQ
jgi:hypothetical protein